MKRIGASILSAAIGLAGCSHGAANSHARVGQAAPSWTQSTSAGSRLSLDSLRGKPVYLNFFATWCGPCNEEAPYINQFQKDFRADGLQIVGVDELESAKQAAHFVNKYKLVYPAVVDDGTLQAQYAVNGLPVHVFIDRSGVISKIVVGEMAKDEIASAIRRIL